MNFNIVKCEECVKQDKTSCVYPQTISSMPAVYLIPYYDENGVYHNHTHGITLAYSCSNGHTWSKYHPPLNLCCNPDVKISHNLSTYMTSI